MKKIIYSIVSFAFLVSMSATPAIAAKSGSCATIKYGTIKDINNNTINLGYDQWGYNYQAHMFNGWYDNSGRPTPSVTGGDSLMMKWNDAWLSNMDCNDDNKLDRHYGFESYKGSGAWLTNHASGTYVKSSWSINTAANTLHIPWVGTDYQYAVTFVQTGGLISGTLTDPYYPTDGTVSGTIIGNQVTFAFQYPSGSVQGMRTFEGTIDASGNLSGTWSETGTENATGDWSVSGFATKIDETCNWTDFVKIVAVPADATLKDGNWYDTNNVQIGPSIWGEFAIIQEVSEDPCGQGVDLGNYKSQLRSGLGNW